MTDNFALKDMFNMNSVETLANALAREYQDFSVDTFLGQVFDQNWEKLELKARVRHITNILGTFLPVFDTGSQGGV